MDVGQLRIYSNWIGKTPNTVLGHAIRAGGWQAVFPKELPVWANQVRNYFNYTPEKLIRFDPEEGAALAEAANRVAFWDDVIGSLSLSGEVYQCGETRLWFQMRPGGTSYHYPGKVNWQKKVKSVLTDQPHLQVFKLVSPDPAKGSSEACFHNWQLFTDVATALLDDDRTVVGKGAIGEPGKWVDVRGKVVLDEHFRGSYNYAETMKCGMDAHTRLDITPHEAMVKQGLSYIEPPVFSKLSERRFPAKDTKGQDIYKP